MTGVWEIVPPAPLPTLKEARERGAWDRALGLPMAAPSHYRGKGAELEALREAYQAGWEAEDGKREREAEAGDTQRAVRLAKIWRAVVDTASAAGVPAAREDEEP